MPSGITGTWLVEIRVDRSMTLLEKYAHFHPARENRKPFRLCARRGEETAILVADDAHHAPDLRLREGRIGWNPCIFDAPITRTTSICEEQR